MVVTFGEIMLRISSQDSGERLQSANLFRIEPGGSESNVAIALANLGNKVSFITKLPNNLLSQGVLRYLKGFNVDTSAIVIGGDRIGLYWTENGVGPRASQVIYDRGGSAFSEIDDKELDPSVFTEKNEWFHVSGITPAVSRRSCETAIEILKSLHVRTKVSVDLNYRANLWKWVGKAQETGIYEIMRELCRRSYLITGNETDFQNALGYRSRHEDKRMRFREVAEQAFSEFDAIRYIAVNIRESHSASENNLSGLLYLRESGKLKEFSSSEYCVTNIVDRVGTGDGFTAGIIHGLLHFPDKGEQVIQFASALGILNHTCRGDASQFGLAEVLHFIDTNGSGRILR